MPSRHDASGSAKRGHEPLPAIKLLHIYLSDHLAGANAGLELAKRCLSKNEGNQLGGWLRAELIPAIVEDRRALEQVTKSLGGSSVPWKDAVAWTAEKIGRLKLNGRLTGYSPLSRLVELEGLAIALRGKLCAWEAVTEIATKDSRLAGHDLDRLIERARQQQAALDEQRLWAARVAWTSTEPEP